MFKSSKPPIQQQVYREKLEIGFQDRSFRVAAGQFQEVSGTYNFFKLVGCTGEKYAVEIDNSGRWMPPISAEFSFPECFKSFRIYNLDAIPMDVSLIFGLGEMRVQNNQASKVLCEDDTSPSGVTMVLPKNPKRTLARFFNYGEKEIRIGDENIADNVRGDYIPIGQHRDYYSTDDIYATGSGKISIYWEERA